MSSAADTINAIINQSLSLAQTKADDAGGYSQKAIQAVDAIQIDTSAAPTIQAPYINLAQFFPADLPAAHIDQPNLTDQITESLVNALNNFINGYFGDDIAGHAAAVNGLQKMLDQAQVGVDNLVSRLGGDNAARAFLGSRFTRVAMADAVSGAMMEAGKPAGDYLATRATAGTSASVYLLDMFDAGDAASARLITMMASGGTSLSASVEDQVWQRDRARIMAETTRLRDQTVSQWASRGFPLPPGAAAMATLRVDEDAQDKIAQASRDVAIKQIDTLIENIRFAAGQALTSGGSAASAVLEDARESSRTNLDAARAMASMTIEDARDAARLLIEDARTSAITIVENARAAGAVLAPMRNQAISSAVDYIRALAIGPQVTADLAKTVVDAQARAAEVIADYYKARVQAAGTYADAYARLQDLPLRAQIAYADNVVRLEIAKNQGLIGIAEARSQAALGACQAAGNQGAAAISALNAIASLTSSS